jgi:protease IV
MSETDYLVERRLLKKSRSRWRFAAFAVAALALFTFSYWQFGRDVVAEHQAHIARLDIRGVIAGEETTLKLIKRVKESQARAALVVIDSPGGTVAGSDALYSALNDLSKGMPVVAVVDGMAASGGYIAALATDHIIARRTSIVGSIGVLFQYPNIVKLLDTLGVKMEGVKSSPLKAAPNPVETTTPEARAALEAVVMDTFAWFKDLVRERRHLSDAELALVSDGRIFTGKQGLALKLVDGLGDEKDAIAWLEQEKGLPKNLKLKRYRPKNNLEPLDLVSGAASIAHAMGFDLLAGLLLRNGAENQAVVLDGLLVLWHPSAQ